jgi:hypothetical protein
MARSIARAVRGASGMMTTFPPLRVITKVRCPRSMPSASMSAFAASETRSPLRASRDQCMLRRRSDPGGDQERAELVAVQAGGVGFVVQAGAADMRGRGMIEELFLERVAVEPGDGAQPAGDGGPGSAAGFQIAGKELDVRAAGLEQAELVLLAPAGELPQVQLVGLAGHRSGGRGLRR